MKKAAKLLEERQKINKKIEDIQKRCPHFNITLKSIQERLDSSAIVIRYVCSECFLPMGYPSKKEIQDFLKK